VAVRAREDGVPLAWESGGFASVRRED